VHAAYATFRQEAQDVRTDYQPRAVNTGGWKATQQAWQALFPLVVLRCFLHDWLAIRSRSKLTEAFAALSERAWGVYRAPDRRRFGQRLRRLWEWSQRHVKAAWVLEQVQNLCEGPGSAARRMTTRAGTGRATCWTSSCGR
jgi:hypothetical protein